MSTFQNYLHFFKGKPLPLTSLYLSLALPNADITHYTGHFYNETGAGTHSLHFEGNQVH